jgi:hypothetical protein
LVIQRSDPALRRRLPRVRSRLVLLGATGRLIVPAHVAEKLEVLEAGLARV